MFNLRKTLWQWVCKCKLFTSSSSLLCFQHLPQEETGRVEHAVQSSQAIWPFASFLHPEKHVLAQILQLRQLLFQLLGGGRVTIFIHPLWSLVQLGGDLLLLLLWQHQLVFVLVQLVLEISDSWWCGAISALSYILVFLLQPMFWSPWLHVKNAKHKQLHCLPVSQR